MSFEGVHHLDTSALYKLVIYPDVREPGSDRLNSYIGSNFNFQTSSLCVGEALGVIKSRFFKKNRESYFLAVNRLHGKIKVGKLKVNKIELVNNFDNAFEIVRRYGVDIVDALQVVHVREANIKTMFISADNDLCKAAKDRGIVTWNIIEDNTPPQP